MTRVMDGVLGSPMRPGAAAMALPVAPVMAKPRPAMRRISAATSRATTGVRYVTGMDGIRRAVPTAPATSPREVLRNMQAPAPQAVLAPAVAEAMIEATAPVWKLPSLRLPAIEWRRPAMAFGLVAMALVASGVTIKFMTAERGVTARAETTAPSLAPTPAQAAPVVAPTPQKTGLQQILDSFVATNGDMFGIVVKDMKTGETAAINPDRQIMSASLYKLFVAQRIYQRIDLAELGYSNASGSGTGRNIDQCLTIMINVSDNGCGRALGAILGWGHQDQALELEGYKQTTLASPQQTSAGDVAKLFTRLYEGTLVSANSSEHFMHLLKDQRVNNRLPKGLPAGTVIAHKTGDLDGVVHDAGIVYGPKTNYLVVVTSGPWRTPGNAPGMFADLSRQLWNYFEN